LLNAQRNVSVHANPQRATLVTRRSVVSSNLSAARDPCLLDVLPWRHADLASKDTREVARAHVGVLTVTSG
jgi:hypothetical protein